MIATDPVSLETNSAQDSTIRPAAHRGAKLPAAHAPWCDLQIRRYSTGRTECKKHRQEEKQVFQGPFLAMLRFRAQRDRVLVSTS